MTKSYPAPHVPTLDARWHGGTQTPTLLVMHSTVTSSAAGAARSVAHFFATEDNKTSAHYVVDAKDTIQCVGDHTVAYHCGHNQDSIGIEMCDMPVLTSIRHWFLRKNRQAGKKTVWPDGKRTSPLRWLVPNQRAVLRRSAQLAGDLCLAYGIRPVFLNPAQLRAWDKAGRPAHLGGITTHANMSTAFHESTHWDPGKWPQALFMERVKLRIRNKQKATA